MATLDPAILAHLEWIGFVQPTGLVVSAPALVRAGAILDRRDIEGQRLLRECVEERAFSRDRESAPYLPDFHAFAASVLGWNFSPRAYAGTPDSPIPPELEVPLPDYREVLRPDFAVRELDPKDGASPWQLLVRVLQPDQDFDRVVRGEGSLDASAHGRMERLLRHTGVSAGLLSNGRALRLVSAPRGESSGWVDFRVADMLQTAGRPISTALRLLLGQPRLLSLPRAQRLAALLDDSRKFQNEVSERLAEQVLHALYELLRGFQAAHDASGGELLRQPLAEHPDEVYRALLTVILRLVFLLYAEERDMLPEEETFLRYYSLAGLHERLREDAALYPDTMDQRYGAWAQLLVLFRMVFDGGECGAMRLPQRHGVLFDPDRYPFLEGRRTGAVRQVGEPIEPPLVPDGTIFRALEKLLILDGERISYRALDVEQIGSVYETMMGFRLQTATGRSVAIKAQKKQGAPTAVDLDALVREPAGNRDKWLQDRTDRKLSESVKKPVAAAATVEDLHAALLPVIDAAATPDLVPMGAMVLQPSEERRRSGSHYTPRSLTEPIIRTTLEPILARLRGPDGRAPRPAQILDLKVCDPAMGSGAFLVEACRQLGDALVEAWRAHSEVPAIPPDEDEVIFARRLIAQRCLYGVDKNPVAVDLAKVSLWLVTLAKDHALTFVDHALRHGDSLVGLSREQIEAFNWDTEAAPLQSGFETMRIRHHSARIGELRQLIREADEKVSDWELRDLWNEAQFEVSEVRLFGDLALAAFFEGEKSRDRERKRNEFASAVLDGEADRYRTWLAERRREDKPLAPFHWEIEFPEVFDRENPGFDAFAGNPPFLAGIEISGTFGKTYLAYIKEFFPGCGGQADLVASFFRRAFSLLRRHGTLGLIATNTIAQGDTRRASLLPIRRAGGWIYHARRRLKWPGSATVHVSIVYVEKASKSSPTILDGRFVDKITAFLFHQGPDEDPNRLASNTELAFKGLEPYADGFIFEDGNSAASPVALYFDFWRNEHNRSVLSPYLNGQEMNTSPDHTPSRYAISFGDMSLAEARRWPDLLALVESKVKAQRETKAADVKAWPWWKYWRPRPDLLRATSSLTHVFAISDTSARFSVARVSSSYILNKTLVVIALDHMGAFSVLQSSLHENWVRLMGSTMKDDPRYTVDSCFETFPFPESWKEVHHVGAAGQSYYEFRAGLMVSTHEGLTKIYNRFHDPYEQNSDILKLRHLHAAMDRAVLDAYGWSDIPTDSEFLLDYEIDEEAWGKRKKPYRYRWPDDVRDEVLARLLDLNAERAAEEARAGAAATTKKRGTRASPKRSPEAQTEMELLS